MRFLFLGHLRLTTAERTAVARKFSVGSCQFKKDTIPQSADKTLQRQRRRKNMIPDLCYRFPRETLQLVEKLKMEMKPFLPIPLTHSSA